MTWEQRDETGSLFRAKERKTDNSPELTGSAKIAGVEYWVSGWTKKTRDGDKWLSLAFTPKDAKPEKAPKPRGDLEAADAGGIRDMQDDIPF